MPELPEVETIKNYLSPRVVGRTFTAVRIHDPRPVQEMSPGEFTAALIGQRISGLSRRGKFLVFDLSAQYLIIHLRMTGALLWNPPGEEPFTRAKFLLDDGSWLVYTDIRRFGTFYLVSDASCVTGRLGVEPLSRAFTPARLGKLLAGHSAPIKSVILNQELIAGVGNMYADEALFLSRIHPQRLASSLTEDEIGLLHEAIREVLNKGIQNKGASIRNYRCPDGAQGSAHRDFCVAHRAGDPCPRCGRPIIRIVVSQRGTYFCPSCQKATGTEK